jgi:hypothetical protein
MKKIYAILMVTFIVLVTVSVQNSMAQSHTVATGSTYTYTTTSNVAGSSFTWSVTGGSAGSDFVYTPSGIATQSIQWVNAGTYTVHVYATASTCPDPTETTITVTVVGTTIQFTAPLTSGPVCSDPAADVTLGLTFSRALDASEYPVVVRVNIVADGTTTNNVDISLASGTNLVISGATYHFSQNTSTASLSNTVTIVSATTAKSGSITAVVAGGVNVHTRTVNPIPNTGTITHD